MTVLSASLTRLMGNRLELKLSVILLVFILGGTSFMYVANAQHNTATHVNTPADEGHSKAETASHHDSENESQQELEFRLVGAANNSTGRGEVNIHISGNVLRVDVEVSRAIASSEYNISLVALPVPTNISSPSAPLNLTSITSVCSNRIGTLITGEEGEGEAHLETELAAGNYSIGLALCVLGMPELVTSPGTELAVVGHGFTPVNETNERAKVVNENQTVDSEIENAANNGRIPVVVQLGNTGASVAQLDPRFSVSVSQPYDNSLIVTISASNVTGSRILLINITKNALPALQSGGLLVKYDNATIPEAASLMQVLYPENQTPSYIIIGTASGYQLLIYIPHFSTHIIQLIAEPLRIMPALAAQDPMMVAAVAAVISASVLVLVFRGRIKNKQSPLMIVN